MAFPTVPTVADGRVLTANQGDTSATRTFPSLSGLTKSAGDLLIAICFVYQASGTNATFSGWGAGFTEFGDFGTSGSTVGIGVAYKWSTGAESGTFTVTQAGTPTGHASFIILAIPGANIDTIPEAGSFSSALPANPASFNPAGWDAEDTLWIGVNANGETSAAGSWTANNGAPTNYTDYVGTNPADTSTIGQVAGAVAFRQLNAASEDVGTFSQDTSNTRSGAILIAVRPFIPVFPTYIASGRGSFPGMPHELKRRRPAYIKEQTRAETLGPIVQTPVFGGAIAGGVTPVAVVTNTSQGVNANGNAPAPRTVLTAQGANANGTAPAPSTTLTSQGALGQGTSPAPTTTLTSQGATGQGTSPTATATAVFTIQGALAQGAGPAPSVPAGPGGVDGNGTGPIAVVSLTAQGALGQGNSPVATATAVFTIQGADAAGNTPFPTTTLTSQGASGQGTAPTPTAPVTSQGALGQGNGPGSSVTVDPGQTDSNGTGPGAVVSLASQGATSGGNAPVQGDITETATIGGATSGGNEPTAVVGLTSQGATAQGNSPAPTTVLTSQGATASGNAPSEFYFESPTPGGATAQGNSPSANVTTSPGGSSANGNAPSPTTILTSQGASASGTAPSESSNDAVTPGGAISGGFASTPAASVDFGGSSTGDGQIDAVVFVDFGGATSGGNTPGAPLQETPIFGGAISGGNSPTPDAAVDFGGASTSSGGVTVYVSLTPGGAIGAGRAPTEIGVTPPAPIGPTPGSGGARRVQNPYNRIEPEKPLNEEEEAALLLISLGLE